MKQALEISLIDPRIPEQDIFIGNVTSQVQIQALRHFLLVHPGRIQTQKDCNARDDCKQQKQYCRQLSKQGFKYLV